MTYTVVILSRNASNLRQCLAAIRQHEPKLDPGQIVVVDDDETGEIEAKFREVRLLTGAKPFVFARNANMGLRHSFTVARSDAAILLNDDALLSKHRGFSKLVSAAEENTEYGIVASSCNNVGNPNQHPKGHPYIRLEKRMLCFVCVLIPFTTWVRVGPLDERFTGYGFEDDAYSLEVRRAGLKLGVFDGCYVDHSRLKSTFRGEAYPREEFEANRRLFFDLYGQIQ